MDLPAVSTESGELAFGRYRLVEIIGEGGMAVVYDALIDGPRGFARRCVVKRIRPELSRDPYFVDMLATEARLCGLLRHPNIVPVFDFGEVRGEYFLAMEHIDGFDLTTVLGAAQRAQLHPSAGVVAYVTYELARALAYAHSLTDDDGGTLDIVHRDVSPSNVMLSEQGGVLLLDFGIAKAAVQVRDEATRTGTLKGKLGYMSPEQADGLHLDKRSDIFALGVVAHELSTVKRLFKGDNDLHTLRLIREANVSPPSAHTPNGDAELDRIICRMLARSADARFQSCDELVAALEPLVRRLHGDGSATRQYLTQVAPPKNRNARPLLGAPPRLLPFEEQPTTANKVRGENAARTPTLSAGELRPGKTVGVPPPRRARAPWYALAVATAGLVAAGATFLVRGRGRPPNPAETPFGQVAAAPSPANAVEIPARVAAVSAAPAALPSPQVEGMKRVRVRVEGPAGAEARVDGRLLGVVPVEAELPRAPGTSRSVTVTLAGHARWTRTIAADASMTLNARLLRATPARKKTAPPAPGRPVIKNPFE